MVEVEDDSDIAVTMESLQSHEVGHYTRASPEETPVKPAAGCMTKLPTPRRADQ
jgi:hypothetical protein